VGKTTLLRQNSEQKHNISALQLNLQKYINMRCCIFNKNQ